MIWCIDSPGFGGSEMDFIERSKYLVDKEDKIILSYGVDAIFLEEIKKLNVQIIYKKVGNTLATFVPSLFFFLKYCWSYKTHTFAFWAHHIDSNRWLQLFSAFFKFKFILIERLPPSSAMDFKKSKLAIPLKRYITSRSVKNLVCGHSQVDGYTKLFHTNNCMAIPNSRNCRLIRERVIKYKKDFASQQDYKGCKIVTVGRLSEQKDQLNIIKAVKYLENKGDFSLIIVGEGELMQTLKDTAVNTGFKNISFIGFDSDPLRWFSIANIFVLNSLSEGLPGALIEAMAAGVPCIATDIPGNNELILHEKTGLLVKVKSPVDLANAIERLANDKDLCDSLSKNAFEHVLKHYDENIERVLWQELFYNLRAEKNIN